MSINFMSIHFMKLGINTFSDEAGGSIGPATGEPAALSPALRLTLKVMLLVRSLMISCELHSRTVSHVLGHVAVLTTSASYTASTE